jgi:4-amino-4-deoxy-L-arabinose transferase-like glycosyltransferase
LFAYITAGIYKVFSADLVYVRVLNIILGVAICWFIYLIGATLVDRQVGLMACLVAAFYKPLILYSIVPLKEALSTLCFAAVLYFFLSLIDEITQEKMESGIHPPATNRHMLLKAVALGLAAGLLINVRPNALVIIPLLFALPLWYAFWDRLPIIRVGSALVVVLLGAVLIVSPFMVRNYIVAGKLTLTTSQGGFNLYLGNNLSNPDPYFRPVSFATSSAFEQGTQFTIEASRRTGHKMTSEEASQYWTKETLREAAQQPGAFAWKLWQKVLVVVNRFEACDHYDIDFLSDFVKIFKLPFFSFWVIFPLAMAGLILGVVRDRKTRAGALILGVYALTLVAFFSNGRYRLPMVTLLIPLAVSGALFIIETIRHKQLKQAGIYVGIVLLFLILGNLPVRATDDKSAYYNTHALIMFANGKQNEAIYYWEQSSAMDKPFSAFANRALALLYFQRGDPKHAHEYLNRIKDTSFAAARKNELLGDILHDQHNLAGAAEFYEKSLRINIGQRDVILKLIDIYKKISPSRVKEYERKYAYISSFYDLI